MKKNIKKRNWFLNVILFLSPIAALSHLLYLIFVRFEIYSLIYVFIYPIWFYGILKGFRWAYFYGFAVYLLIIIRGLLNQEYISLIALIGAWLYHRQKDYFTE